MRRSVKAAGVTAAVLLLAVLGPASLSAKTTSSHGGSTAKSLKPPTAVTLTLVPEDTAGPPLMGLGVQWDPYDSFQPTPALWNLIENRVAFMAPGFIRVVEPASDYFEGYDSSHNPTYRWKSTHMEQLLQILSFAQAHNIAVVLGDWADPVLDGDARIPAEFIKQLHDTYGFTNIRYYDPINEPNYDASCDFTCWKNVMTTLQKRFTQLGMKWLQLVGPDNGNSWDDTARVQKADEKTGLDTDNPANDAWVTTTLQSIPKQIGAYDSHRYATIWGIENGVYGEQMITRRDEISQLDSPEKPYFEGEVGLTVRQADPFRQALNTRQRELLPALIDPSAHTAQTGFVDSQPHIAEFAYGTWMDDMVIQALDGGLAGASAWDLDDAMHAGGGYGSQNLKQWGFWNSLGGQDGYPRSDLNLRAWYYAWAVLSRSFPGGAQALTVPRTGLAGVRVAAARIPSGSSYAFSFALVNETGGARTVKLVVPSLRQHRMKLALYAYLDAKRPTDTNGFPIPVRIVRDVDLARGYSVEVPPHGVAVLTSVGLASTGLAAGPKTLVASFGSFRGVFHRSKGWKLDKSNPLQFNGDKSRATPSRNGTQYLIYREPKITSFELKVYGSPSADVRAYATSDGGRWTSVPLASTPPAPALEGRALYVERLLPTSPLPLFTSLLKLEVSNRHTELGQVTIHYG